MSVQIALLWCPDAEVGREKIREVIHEGEYFPEMTLRWIHKLCSNAKNACTPVGIISSFPELWLC